MSLTRDKKNPNLWHARIYPDGRKKDPRTGKPSNVRESYSFSGSEVEAREWYRSLHKSVKPTKVVKLAPTIDQAYNDFMEHYKQTVAKSTCSAFIITYARFLKPFFGQYRPSMLTPAIVTAYKAKRELDTYLPGKHAQLPQDDTPEEALKRKPIARSSIHKELMFLKSMLSWLTDPENGLAAPMTFTVRGYSASQIQAPPKLIPSRRDMIMLIRSCRNIVKYEKKDGSIVYEKHDRKFRALFAVAYYSGLRREELLNLEAKNIQGGYIRIMGKGDKIRTVPIVTRLKPYIGKLPKKGLLFVNNKTGEEYDNIAKLLIRSCETASIPLISLHTFRHAFAVHALMRGVSLRTLQLVMGHSSIKTTEKYLQLVPDDLTYDLDKVARRTAPHQATIKRSSVKA